MLSFVTKTWVGLEKAYSPAGVVLLCYCSTSAGCPHSSAALRSASVPERLGQLEDR